MLFQLAGEFTGKVRFAKLNVDDAPDLGSQCDVTGMPTLIVLRDGRAVDRVAGMAPPAAMKRWLGQAAMAAPDAA